MADLHASAVRSGCPPAAKNDTHELYLMCDDLMGEMARLGKQGVTCAEVREERWGSLTRPTLPGGGQLGLYEPKHPLAHKK